MTMSEVVGMQAFSSHFDDVDSLTSFADDLPYSLSRYSKYFFIIIDTLFCDVLLEHLDGLVIDGDQAWDVSSVLPLEGDHGCRVPAKVDITPFDQEKFRDSTAGGPEEPEH